MPTFGEFQQAVAQRIQDSAQKLAQPAIDACIKKAITGRYTDAKPLIRIKDFAGDSATFQYIVDSTVFPDWVDDASFFRQFEYPANENPPAYLDSKEWVYPVRDSSSVKKLELIGVVPQTGKTLRIEYSVPHKEDGSTVPAGKVFQGVADLAASYACVELAAVYNQLVDPVFSAPTDGAHQSKSQHYLTLAKKYEGAFEAAFGLGAEPAVQPPAAAWTEWESPLAEGGPKLTH